MTQNVRVPVVMKPLATLNLTDKFLFDEAMEKPEVYQATVSILLEKELEFLAQPETEKELRVSSELRSIRLDVISMDADKTVYYTEMQQKDTKNLKKRSRYYQAQLDVSLLEPGVTDFNKLNDACLILVAPFDIFGRGLYRYTFDGVCRECPDLHIDDGAVRVFINTKGKNREEFSQEFLDFMDYITETTKEVAARVESRRIKRIHNQVEQIRLSEKIGVKYMQRWEEIEYERIEAREKGHAEGLAEGLAEGHAEGLAEGLERGVRCKLISLVIKKMRKGKSEDVIAEETEESVEDIHMICETVKKYASKYDINMIYQDLYEKENGIDK